MTAGTTELRLSEDLWAQVESRMVQVPHTEAEWPLDRGDSEGWSKPAWCVAYVGIGLNPHAGSGRLHAELHGAWGLKPYRGQPDVRNSWEGGWKRGPGWKCEPTSQPKGRDWKPSTYRRARQCSTRQGMSGQGLGGGTDDGDTEP